MKDEIEKEVVDAEVVDDGAVIDEVVNDEGENALAILGKAELPAKFDDEDFKSVSAADYLPRLQLMTANSKKCKKGEFPINHYALVKGQDFIDLGETIDIAILAWRPKAIDMGEIVITCHDPKNDEFIRIQEQSKVKNSGCMFGPEYLVYVPDQNEYATLFLGTKSARRMSPGVKALMHKPATMKSQLIDNKKFEWFAPAVTACSTPFDTPSIEEIREYIEKFENPPESTIERVADENDEGRAR